MEAGQFDIKESSKDIKSIMTLNDYIDKTLQETIPTNDEGIINYTFIQRGYTLNELKIEHNEGAFLSRDGSKHLPHVVNHGDKIVTVQFTNIAKEEKYADYFILDDNTKESVSEFYIYIKQDGVSTIDLSDIKVQYVNIGQLNQLDIDDQVDNTFLTDRIMPIKNRAHFETGVDPIHGYNEERFLFYGIGHD